MAGTQTGSGKCSLEIVRGNFGEEFSGGMFRGIVREMSKEGTSEEMSGSCSGYDLTSLVNRHARTRADMYTALTRYNGKYEEISPKIEKRRAHEIRKEVCSQSVHA